MVIFVKSSSDLPECFKMYPNKGGSFVACGSRCDLTLLERNGFTSHCLDLTADEEERFLRDYIELIDVLGQENGSRRLWWASDAASKNRVYSPLLPLLKDMQICMKAIQEAEASKTPLIILAASNALADVLKSLCSESVMVGYAQLSLAQRLLRQIKGRWTLFRELLSGLRVVVQRCREAWEYFGPAEMGQEEGHPVYLLKSFSYPSAFTVDGQFDDPFYKELPKYLAKNLPSDWSVRTIVMAFDDRVAQYEKMIDSRQSVIAVESYLQPLDILSGSFALLVGILRPFRIGRGVTFLGHNVAGVLQESFECDGGRVSLLHYLYYAIGKRLSATMDIRACVMTMEGNPWENMFVAGLRHGKTSTAILGVQHAVLIKEASGVFKGHNEVEHGWLPDYIMTTGSITADIIRRYSQYPSDKVIPSCALRYGYLYDMSRQARSVERDSTVVLVVLDGLPGADDMVQYVLRESGTCSDTEFLIRAHPVRPLEYILAEMGERLDDYPHVNESPGGSVLDDVRGCDVVMYWGTTVSLEALMMGKPLIHYDNGSVLSCDPLFDFSAYKWIVADGVALGDVLSEIVAVKGSQQENARTGVEYIEQYLSQVNDRSLHEYIERVPDLAC